MNRKIIFIIILSILVLLPLAKLVLAVADSGTSTTSAKLDEIQNRIDQWIKSSELLLQPTQEVKDCTSVTEGRTYKTVGTCKKKNECKTNEGYSIDENTKECQASITICCLPNSCESMKGIVAKTWEDQKANCKDGGALLPATFSTEDKEAGHVCCQSKEQAREVPKKPGTWGRLGICFKFEVFGSNEGKWCDEAIKTVSDITKSGLTSADSSALETKLKAIKSETNPTERLNKIDDYNKAASALRQKLTTEAGKDPTEKVKKTLEKQQKAIESSQDSVDKIKKIYAITQFECILNYISVGIGIAKTSMLVFGSGDKEMGSFNPETALRGTKLCTTCNEDPLRLCTKERC